MKGLVLSLQLQTYLRGSVTWTEYTVYCILLTFYYDIMCYFLVAQSNLWWLAPTLISYVEEDLLFLSVCKPCDSRRNKHFCLKELGLAFIHYHSGWYWTSKCALTNTATEKSQRNACVIIRKVTKSYILLKMMKSYSRHKAFSRKLYIFEVYHTYCHDVWKLITL